MGNEKQAHFHIAHLNKHVRLEVKLLLFWRERNHHRLVATLKLKADVARVVRSLVGHVVAGRASDAEAQELREFSRSLTAERLKKR